MKSDEKKNPPTKKYTLKKTHKPTHKAIYFREYFFLHPKKIFCHPSFFLIKLFSPSHGLSANTNSCAANVNRFGQTVVLRTNSTTAGNIKLKPLWARGSLHPVIFITTVIAFYTVLCKAFPNKSAFTTSCAAAETKFAGGGIVGHSNS